MHVHGLPTRYDLESSCKGNENTPSLRNYYRLPSSSLHVQKAVLPSANNDSGDLRDDALDAPPQAEEVGIRLYDGISPDRIYTECGTTLGAGIWTSLPIL